MKIILTICEFSNTKFSKKQCFDNLYNVFKNEEFYILADNLSKDFENYICSFDIKFYENKLRGKTKYFFDKLNFCKENFDQNDNLYLVEDDYIHLENSNVLLEEGLQCADYVTLYDHPDKYKQCPYSNPEITDLGENTVLFRTNSTHWKYTNSTTGTFACKKSTLLEDFETWSNSYKNCPTSWWDYLSFKELRSTKNRKIASCIPGRSSHMHSLEMYSPIIKLPI